MITKKAAARMYSGCFAVFSAKEGVAQGEDFTKIFLKMAYQFYKGRIN